MSVLSHEACAAHRSGGVRHVAVQLLDSAERFAYPNRVEQMSIS
jgi:hypothetical protein